MFGVPANIGLSALALILFAQSSGLPAPGQAALITSVLLAKGGDTSIVVLILVSISAAWLGSIVGYMLGKHMGRRVVNWGPGKEKREDMLLKAEEFIEKHGMRSIVLARWFGYGRIFVAPAAGLSHMNLIKFMIASLIGCSTWIIAISLIVYILGLKGIIIATVISYLLLIIVLLLVIRRIDNFPFIKKYIPSALLEKISKEKQLK